MNKNQLIAAVAGVVVAFGVYCIKIIIPIAKLKREHSEILATNPPNAVVGGSSGIIALLIVVMVTGVVITMLRGRG